MSQISEHYIRLSDAFEETLRGVSPNQWDAPTPCTEWNVRQLVEHVSKNAGIFFGLVGEPAPALPPVDTDPAEAWRVSDRTIREALVDAARANQEFDGFFGRTTFAKSVDAFMSFDLIVHRWDLARATGQDERVDPVDIDWALDQTKGWGEAMRGQNAFGPALETPRGADAQTRLLAFLGRRA